MAGERRNFVRIKKMITVDYKVVIDKFASTAVPADVTQTETISGNGLTMMLPKPLKNGERLEMDIELPDGGKKPVELEGEVIGSVKKGAGEYQIKVKFTDINEQVRDRLIKYIFRENVKSGRKEKKK